MSENTKERRKKGKKTRFPVSLFFIHFGFLLLMSGLHSGLIVLMGTLKWNDTVQSIVPIVYWASVAFGLTMYTRYRMKQTYDEPMQMLAEATARVAAGDFSIYLPAIHTADRYDYLDTMFLNFNKMVAELGSIETLKTDFFSNVSHEIKTPIAVIQNSAQLLQNDQTLRHMFDKFYQGDTSHSTEGNGLGLALVLRILQINDCTVAAESKWGKGTKFTVTIPLRGELENE